MLFIAKEEKKAGDLKRFLLTRKVLVIFFVFFPTLTVIKSLYYSASRHIPLQTMSNHFFAKTALKKYYYLGDKTFLTIKALRGSNSKARGSSASAEKTPLMQIR